MGDLALLAGGLWSLWQKAIRWHIPSQLLGCCVMRTLGWLFSPETLAAPQFICCLVRPCSAHSSFVIYPMTASTTNRGRLILARWRSSVRSDRSFGGYPDGVAFAVLAGEHHRSWIHYYTRPRVYGHRKG
ncbi:RnfABCDGE type electron transport complex subunit D [Shigella flexneri]